VGARGEIKIKIKTRSESKKVGVEVCGGGRSGELAREF
jgi:hypothetical protein